MEIYSDAVQWGGVEIPFKYSFSQRKTLSISVYPDLSVTVKAPEGTGVDIIREHVYRRSAWINRQWKEFEKYLPKQPPRRYISGETHRYLGRQYRLRIRRGKVESVKCYQGYLWVTTKNVSTPEKIKLLLDEWYRCHAKVIFHERIKLYHQRMTKNGVPSPIFQIRKLNGRWGSFSSAGRITLNLSLIKVPTECIDYVILHELCHFKEKHHGSKFWGLLKKLMPDYIERRAKLNMFDV